MKFSMPKIMFLHGFTSGGQCEMANTLRESCKNEWIIIAPDLPLDPNAALQLIEELCKAERPDILVGSSRGAFYAQQAVQTTGIPAILSNPHFKMSDFLANRLGTARYKCPRTDSRQEYTVTPELITAFKEMEARQFIQYKASNRERVWGLFGTLDTLANFRDVFSQYYSESRTFEGNHTMSAENVRTALVPTIREMLLSINLSGSPCCH